MINSLLLAEDKFMAEKNLRQSEFTYSDWGTFTKNKDKITKQDTCKSRYMYQNKLLKACFQHDMFYGDFKDLTARKAADKVFRDKAFAKYLKYGRYQRWLASMLYKYFDKKTSNGGCKNYNY